ncbi:MAG: hypothetical protein OEO82_07935 [Gammaproteobacteria bacterium]|nr:hypothetical protein [Gammaproteobacteria bacterium]
MIKPSGAEQQKRFPLRTVLLIGGALLLVFAVLGAVSVAGWEYSNSNTFCANACHEVHPEEPYAHQTGRHANVACVECHIGRLPTFASMAEKSGHIAHAWNFLVGYDRPTYSTSMSGAEKSCEGCHTNTPHRHNIVNTTKKFATDRRSTESKMTLTMRLAGRNFGGEHRRGVNWHASGAVRFIADDPQRLDIRWVEVTADDGSKTVYNNIAAPLAAADIEEAEKHVMDCIDCHNRAGHPFRNPEEDVDAALAEGRLSGDLPYIKERVIELLEREFETKEEAHEILQQAWNDYQQEFPEWEEKDPEAWQAAREFLEERQEFMTNLMARNRFVEEGVSWRSFPDHMGHQLDPGCFRCHSGRMQTDKGRPITVNCTNCHSIPLVTRRDRVPDFFLSLIDKEKPDSHHDPAFISKHMDIVGEECTTCHEETRYGANDRTYCSNSGCHGETWEYLHLQSLRTAARTAKVIHTR